MELGPFTVRCALRFDNPAFPKYLVFLRGVLIGAQFSVPNQSDCEWLERTRGRYADETQSMKNTSWQLSIRPHRRGRPRKLDAERELAEAMNT